MSAQPAGSTAILAKEQNIGQVIALCERALEICDALGIAPQIGARLQEVIDALDEAAQHGDADRG